MKVVMKRRGRPAEPVLKLGLVSQLPAEESDSAETDGREALRGSPAKAAHLSPGALSPDAAPLERERSFKSEADANKDAAAVRQVQ